LFETVPSRFLTEIDPELYELWGASRRLAVEQRQPDLLSAGQETGRRGYGHGMYVQSAANEYRNQEKEPKPQKSEWEPGMLVYHDEYGSGTIIKVTPSQSAGVLVIVRFDSGKVAQFFPKYTKKLEKVEH
jgi:hypothetical protein